MKSIRSRLLLGLTAGPLLVLILGGVGVYGFVQRSLWGQMDVALETQARSISTLIKIEHDEIEFEYDEDIVAPSTDLLFTFYTADGTVFVSSAGVGNRALPMLAGNDEDRAMTDIELPGGGDGRALSIRFVPRIEAEHHDRATGAGSIQVEPMVVTVAIATEHAKQVLETLLVTLVAIGFAVAITTVVLVWVGVRVSLTPLDQLSAKMRKVEGAGDDAGGGVDNGVKAPTELVPVYEEFNRMLARVSQTLGRERRFTDAAAHELRTPLAELRTLVEVAAKWPEGDRPILALKEAGEIGQEMQCLVETLLMLGRASMGESVGIVAPCGLSEIAEHVADRFRSKADDGRITLSTSIAPGIQWRVSETATKVMVRNLLDNAIEYTPSGGTVRLTVADGPGASGRLCVTNEPVDIDSDDLDRMFEPFWRLDPSRTDRGHAGLGLSIVQQLVQAAGLSCTAELIDEKKLVISICSGSALSGSGDAVGR